MWTMNGLKNLSRSNSYHFNYEIVSKAIEHLKSESGDIYSVQNIEYIERYDSYSLNIDRDDFYITSSFENAIKYIEKETKLKELSWDNKDQLFWYEIKKWSLSENSNYEEIICYDFVDNKIMFFSFRNTPRYAKEYFNDNFKLDCDLNLITPFTVGDILTVDCRPYVPLQNIIILENHYNSDCCSLQGLYFDSENDTLELGAVKHGNTFKNSSPPLISPLYRITKPKEPLPEKEKIFDKIKTFLNGDSQKGDEMSLWIDGVETRKEITHHSGFVTVSDLEKFMEEFKCN